MGNGKKVIQGVPKTRTLKVLSIFSFCCTDTTCIIILIKGFKLRALLAGFFFFFGGGGGHPIVNNNNPYRVPTISLQPMKAKQFWVEWKQHDYTS